MKIKIILAIIVFIFAVASSPYIKNLADFYNRRRSIPPSDNNDSPPHFPIIPPSPSPVETPPDIEIYWLNQTKITKINWGTLIPGQNKSIPIKIKNVGSSTVTLTLATANWNPPNAQEYLSLTWNYTNTSLSPNNEIPLCLSLTVSPTIQNITTFSFDIVISATNCM